MIRSTVCMDRFEFPTKPPDVTVRPLVFDWNDPSLLPARERRMILDQGLSGCWYVNPLFKIFCPMPTPEFLRKARDCQAAWFRQLDRQFPDRGWRNLMQVKRHPVDQQTGFTGVLIINGTECDPQDWAEIEKLLGTRPKVQERKEAFQALKQRDWEALRQFSLSELQARLAESPGPSLYVNPGITVTMGFPLPAFYAEADRRSCQWHGTLCRELTSQGKKELAVAADWPTRMLVFHGTLVVDGEIYVPGRWPTHQVKASKLRKGPFGARTVPPEYLGLKPEFLAARSCRTQ